MNADGKEQIRELHAALKKISKELHTRASEVYLDTYGGKKPFAPSAAKDAGHKICELMFVSDRLQKLRESLGQAIHNAQLLCDARHRAQQHLLARIRKVIAQRRRSMRHDAAPPEQAPLFNYNLFQEYAIQFGVLYDATVKKRAHTITVTEGWNHEDYIKRTKIIDGLADICTRELQPIHNGKTMVRRTWLFYK